MRMSKRILAMLLAVLMVASVAPMSVMQAAAENITEAIGDLGDALAVESVETDAAVLAEDGEAAPAETPEETAQPQEEPAAQETAAEETAAQEPAETQAEPTEAVPTEPKAAEPAPTQVASKPAATTKPSATAVKKAARRAPLKAGPEFELSLNAVTPGTPTVPAGEPGQLITEFIVPPVLYTKVLLLSSSGNTINSSLSGTINVGLNGTTHAGALYYRLEYTYGGKTYKTYAASYVRERPLTVGRWYIDTFNGYQCGNDNNKYTRGFCYTDTLEVSSVLGLKGAGTIVSAYSVAETASYDDFSAANTGFGRAAATNEWSVTNTVPNSTNKGKIDISSERPPRH